MRVAILYNHDFNLDDDPGREAREDVAHVAQALYEALATTPLRPELMPVGSDPFAALSRLFRDPPDAAINLCESLCGDARGESVVPMLLDLAGIPYTGSTTLSLVLALHKPKAKEVLRARGVPTPDWAELDDPAQADALELPFPLIVKPSREDASSGIDTGSVVTDREALAARVAQITRTFRQTALVERYIEGREIYVPLLGNPPRALPLSEIDFTELPVEFPRIITYAGKWEPESVECRLTPSVPSGLSGPLAEQAIAVALEAFRALECRDYGRVDLRLGEDGTPYVIDINPNCDLSPTAGFARAAQRGGLSYTQLALELVQVARRRHGLATTPAGRSGAAWPDARGDRPVHGGGAELRFGAR